MDMKQKFIHASIDLHGRQIIRFIRYEGASEKSHAAIKVDGVVAWEGSGAETQVASGLTIDSDKVSFECEHGAKLLIQPR